MEVAPDLVSSCEYRALQGPGFRGPQIGIELFDLRGAENHRIHVRPLQNPSERQLDERLTATAGDSLESLHRLEIFGMPIAFNGCGITLL